MMSRKTRAVLAVAIVAAYFGYRALKPGTDSVGDDAAPAVPAAPATPVKLGGIAFKPCSLSSPLSRDSLEAQCASFSVPEDRSAPNGRRIALNIAWLQATANGEVLPDPVFFLAGGPGQAAVTTYPALDPVFREVRKRRHVILVDQRGTGRSNPLDCPLPEDDDADSSPEAMQALAAQCAARLSKRADLRHYTTTDAVADLDAVRQAIGAAQINLVGVSYGTRVAQQYAMRHPAATRSIVLIRWCPIPWAWATSSPATSTTRWPCSSACAARTRPARTRWATHAPSWTSC